MCVSRANTANRIILAFTHTWTGHGGVNCVKLLFIHETQVIFSYAFIDVDYTYQRTSDWAIFNGFCVCLLFFLSLIELSSHQWTVCFAVCEILCRIRESVISFSLLTLSLLTFKEGRAFWEFTPPFLRMFDSCDYHFEFNECDIRKKKGE